MRQIVHTTGPLAAASANNIALAQTPTTAGFNINGSTASGGVATLDVGRRVLLTTTGNETGKNVVLSGTDTQGRTISETLAAPNIGTVYSQLDYKTVTSAIPSAGFAANATLGTNNIASSRPIPLDHYGWPEDAVQVVVTGTIIYAVQYTLDDPYALPVAPLNWFDFPDPSLGGQNGGQTTSAVGGCEYPPAALRMLILDGSGGGSTKMTILQPGILG